MVGDADVLVLPSYREGLSKTLLEGAAMAKPMIATNVPGCREVVLDGINGYLCEPGSSRDLADKMFKILRAEVHTLKQFGIQSRILAEKQFNEEIVISHYLNAINENSQYAV
jgi:glycosyltransferase involved in cell wall biosynthesis